MKRKTITPPTPQFFCTDCGGDAYVGMSGWSGPQGEIIKKDERLCLKCAKVRGVTFSFHTSTKLS